MHLLLQENRGTPDITPSSFSIQQETTDVKSFPQGEDTEKQQFMFVPEERDETRPVIRDYVRESIDGTRVKSGVTRDSSSVGSLNPEIPKPVLTLDLVSDLTEPNQILSTQTLPDSATSVVHGETTETSENRLKDFERFADVATDQEGHAVTSEISHSGIRSKHRTFNDTRKPEEHGKDLVEKDNVISGVSEKDNEALEVTDVISYVESEGINIVGSESLQTSSLDTADSSLTVDDSSQANTTVSLNTEGTIQEHLMVLPQSETEDRYSESLAGAVYTDTTDECPPDDAIVTEVSSVQSMAADVSAECTTQVHTTLTSESKVRFRIIHTEEQGTGDSVSSFHLQVRFIQFFMYLSKYFCSVYF